MKTIALIITVFFLFPPQERNLEPDFKESQEDKEYLKEYFKETYEDLQDQVEDLNKEQMEYKISDAEWSVGEVLEHIILTEEALFQMTKNGMSQPANPERREEVRMNDEQLIAGIEDRSNKVKTSPNLEPSGIYDDPEEALDKLEEQRDKMLDFIEDTSEEDLRNHIMDAPMGAVDAYQSILFIAGHTARHTAQIAEVMADAGFPSDK